MKRITLKHDTRTIRRVLSNNGAKVYWRNSLLNNNWQVTDAKVRKGQFTVKVAHPIFGDWYGVDETDTITVEYAGKDGIVYA